MLNPYAPDRLPEHTFSDLWAKQSIVIHPGQGILECDLNASLLSSLIAAMPKARSCSSGQRATSFI
jgi:hypothetical protein